MRASKLLAVMVLGMTSGVSACGSVSDDSNGGSPGAGGVGGSNANPTGGAGGVGGVGGAGGTAGVTQEPWEALLDAVLDDYCDAMAPCCAAAGLTSSPACRTVRDAAKERFRKLIAKGTVKFDPSGAEACMAELQQSYTNCDQDTFSTVDERFCPEAFVPQIPVGGACDEHQECQVLPGDDIAKCLGDQCFSGKASAAVGDPCNYTCFERKAGASQCFGTIHHTGAGKCAYAEGLACGVDGVCVALLGEGESGCGEFGCAESLRCVEGMCVRKLPTGSDCAFDRDCVEGNWCSSGTCAEQKQVGEACSDGTSMCYCSGGTCREPDYLGWALLCN